VQINTFTLEPSLIGFITTGNFNFFSILFIICKSGKRSEKASKILSNFKIQSRSIDGGIEKVKKILSN